MASREMLRRSCFTIRDITPAFFDRLVSEYQVEMGHGLMTSVEASRAYPSRV
jgi:hypothetical protein